MTRSSEVRRGSTQFRNTLKLVRASFASKMITAVEQACDSGLISKPYNKATMADIGRVTVKSWTVMPGIGIVTAQRLQQHARSYGVAAIAE
jgi:hypothetical protein